MPKLVVPRTLRSLIEIEAEPVKGSQFLVVLAPIRNEGQAKEILVREQGRYPDASHHCSAWRIASPVIERANDDGEPSGSAGRPMLAQLAGANLLDVSAVVVRYFGGTKLGVGGLVRAYGGAVAQAIETAKTQAVVVEHKVLVTLVAGYGHALDGPVQRVLDAVAAKTADVHYGAAVRREIQVGETDLGWVIRSLIDVTSANIELTDTDGIALGD